MISYSERLRSPKGHFAAEIVLSEFGCCIFQSGSRPITSVRAAEGEQVGDELSDVTARQNEVENQCNDASSWSDSALSLLAGQL